MDIWEQAVKYSKESEYKAEISRRKEQIANFPNKCGNCSKWITPQCPRERKKLVASGDRSCEQFQACSFHQGALQVWEKEIEEYETKLSELQK